MDYSKMTVQELAETRRKMAESVNRQIRRLRASGYDNTGALKKIAEPYLRKRRGFSTGKSPLKVNTAGKTKARIEYDIKRKEIAEIRAMERFRQAQTYSIKGIREQRRKARESFKAQLGVEITDKEVEEIYEFEAFGFIKQTLGSPVVNALARAINAGASTAREVRSKIDAMRKKYSEEEIEDMSIEELFEEVGIEFKEEYLNRSRKEEQ